MQTYDDWCINFRFMLFYLSLSASSFYAPPMDLLTTPSLMLPLLLPHFTPAPLTSIIPPNPNLHDLNLTNLFILYKSLWFFHVCFFPDPLSFLSLITANNPPSPLFLPPIPCWLLQRRQAAASMTPSSIMIRMCGSQSRAVSVCVTVERFCAMRYSARRWKSAPTLSSHLENAAPSAPLMPLPPLVVIYLFTHL